MPALKNAKHERFAQALVAGRSQIAAYLEAGYKGDFNSGATRGNATRIAANESVRQRVKELQDAAAKDAIASGSRLIQEQCRLALSDIGHALDEEGRLLPVHKMPPEFRAAVASVKVVTKSLPGTEPVEIEHVSEIKLWDKGAALRDLIPRIVDGDDPSKINPLDAFARSIAASAQAIPVADPDPETEEDEDHPA